MTRTARGPSRDELARRARVCVVCGLEYPRASRPAASRKAPIAPLTVAVVAVTVLAAIPAGWASARAARRFAGTEAPPAWLMILADVAVAACGLVATSPTAAAVGAVLGWTLVLLAAVDVLAFRLPDLATLPLVAAGLAWGLNQHEPPFTDRLIGAAAGWLVLSLVAWIFVRLRGREGLGGGDAKLLAAAGAWLGWRPLPSVVLIGCAVGFVWVALALPFKGKRALAEPLPFGLPLCIGIWVVWLMQASAHSAF